MAQVHNRIRDSRAEERGRMAHHGTARKDGLAAGITATALPN